MGNFGRKMKANDVENDAVQVVTSQESTEAEKERLRVGSH